MRSRLTAAAGLRGCSLAVAVSATPSISSSMRSSGSLGGAGAGAPVADTSGLLLRGGERAVGGSGAGRDAASRRARCSSRNSMPPLASGSSRSCAVGGTGSSAGSARAVCGLGV